MSSLYLSNYAVAVALLTACTPGEKPGACENAAMSCGDAPDDGVCGDAVVGPGEACDAPGDPGCDDSCHITNMEAWVVSRDSPDAPGDVYDVAVDAAGQIIVLGASYDLEDPELSGAPWLLALDPAGAELWQVGVPAEVLEGSDVGIDPRVALAANGGIYVQSLHLHRFGPKGGLVWQAPMIDGLRTSLAVADDAVYTAGIGFGGEDFMAEKIIVQRHDPATGELVWDRQIADGEPSGGIAVAVSGGRVFALGVPRGEGGRPVVVSLDAATGAPGPSVFGEGPELWSSLGVLPSGDLVLAGSSGNDWVVRGLGLDGAVLWNTPLVIPEADGDGSSLLDLAVGPDGTAVVVGEDGSHEIQKGLVRAVSSAGDVAWTLDYTVEPPASYSRVTAAAFGPGFLVLVGSDNAVGSWVRRLGPR